MEHQNDQSADQLNASRSFGNRGKITTRPSRDSIVSSYAAEGAERARNARMYSQQASKLYRENSLRTKERENQRRIYEAQQAEEERKQAQRRQLKRELEQANARTSSSIHEQEAHGNFRSHRVARPLSTQESQHRALASRDAYEQARQDRDALSPVRTSARSTNRDIIDARGSFDSRAFSEQNKILSYSVNEEDKPSPRVDTTKSKSRWRSHSSGDARLHPRVSRRFDFGSLSDSITGRSSFTRTQRGWASFPPFVRVAIPVLVILLAVLLFLMFR